MVAASLLTNELVTYNITAAGVKGTTRLLAGGDYLNNRPARQPDLGNTGNARVVDTLDDRVSSSVYQVNGKIYAVHTVTPRRTARSSSPSSSVATENASKAGNRSAYARCARRTVPAGAQLLQR